MDHFRNCYPPSLGSSDPVHLSAMSTPTASHLLQGQPNQYLLSKIDSSSAFNSATLSSNEIISQSSATNSSSCGYSLSGNSTGSYLGIDQNDANMFNSSSANTTTIVSNSLNLGQHNVTDSGSSYKKKKKHRDRSKKGQALVESGMRHTATGSGAMYPPGHYPVHHYVQQTESVIISTRKLSVVESVPCAAYPGNLGPTSGACHQSSCNINYHSGTALGGRQQSTTVADNYAISHQSAAISNLLNQTANSSASSLNLHCQNEIANLAHHHQSDSRPTTVGQVPKKRHKKKRKRGKEESIKYFSSSTISSQPFPSNLYCAGLAARDGSQLMNQANCDSAKCVSSSSSASSASSSSHSSSSSSSSSSSYDSETERTPGKLNQNMAYDSYRRKGKQAKHQLKSSFSSTNSGSSSNSSSSSSSSSYSSSSSSDDEDNHIKSSRSTSSGTSSSATSRSSSICSKSSKSSAFYGHDVLKQLSVNVNDQLTVVEPGQLPSACNYFTTATISDPLPSASIVKCGAPSIESVNSVTPATVGAPSQSAVELSGSTQHQFAPSFQSSSFSVDTLLQQQQTQANVEVASSLSQSTQPTPSLLNPTLVSLSKQVSTPLSSAVLSDDCNSIGSPLSVESSGKDSGKDESLKLNVKKRDPAEERQRLRSYRIPHHLSQSRSLSKPSEVKSASSSTTTNSSSFVMTTAAATIVTSASTQVATTKAHNSGTPKIFPENPSASMTINSMQVNSAASSSQQSKKDRTVSKAPVTTQNDRPMTMPKKPVAIVSSNAAKMATNPVLAPSHQSSHFLNSSFFVPGATSTFPYSQHYPFSPFMPALFQNQFLSNATPANSKSAGNGSQPRHFLHPAQSQSQLTIFTSPTINSNAATAHTLSSFQFPGLGPMTHSALLSPTFSSSAIAGSSGTAPLLVPKSLNFSPNFSFPHATNALDPLMMFGIASNSKAPTSTSNSSTHHTPPFILPRIVPNTSTSTPTISGTVAKSSSLRSKSERGQSQSKQTVIKSSLIISTTASCTISTNTQHSPLSTILHPQTLLLLPPPIASSFSGKSPVASTSHSSVSGSTDRPISIVCSSSSSSKTVSSANVTSFGASMANLSVPTPTCAPSSTSASVSALRPSPLASSFIFSPNSHSHLPYTLFSPPHPQTLMQPISIQAPPPPSPSSLLGTQLLLSVISPTHRNQLGPTLANAPLAAPQPCPSKPASSLSNTVKTSSSSSSTVAISSKSSNQKETTSKTTNSTSANSEPNEIIFIDSEASASESYSNATVISVFNSDRSISPSSGQFSKSTSTSVLSTVNESQFKDSRSSQYSTLPHSMSTSTKVIRDSLVHSIPAHLSSSKSMPYSYLLPKSASTEGASAAAKTVKPPETSTGGLTSPTMPGVDEFESLVRSVNDTIKSFHSSSDFYDDVHLQPPVQVVEKSEKTEESFNSKKMLSWMIKQEDKPKEVAIIKKRSKSKESTKKLNKKEKDHSVEHCELSRKSTGSQASMSNVPMSKSKSRLDHSHERKHSEQSVSADRGDNRSKQLVKERSKSNGSPEGRRRHKRHKEKKRKGKGDRSTGADRSARESKLDKKSTSRHKARSKRRSRVKQSLLIRDPNLVAEIERLVSQFSDMHIAPYSHTPSTVTSGVTLPPMFRFCGFKTVPTSTKSTNRSGRSTGLRGKLSTGVQSATSQCFLPLKKRQHRNPDDGFASSHHHHHHHSSVANRSSESHAAKAKHQQQQPLQPEETARPESSLSQNSAKSTKKSSRSKGNKLSKATSGPGQHDTDPPKNVEEQSSQSGEPRLPLPVKYESVGIDAHLDSPDPANGPSAVNLNWPAVAPPGDRKSPAKGSVSAASARRAAHGVVATDEGHSHTANNRQKTTVLSSPSTSTTAVQTSAPTSSRKSIFAQQQSSISESRAHRGRKKKTTGSSSSRKDALARAPLGDSRPATGTSSPHAPLSPSPAVLTSDGRKRSSQTPVHVTSGSSLDESSDADDEFDSEDELPQSKCTQQLDGLDHIGTSSNTSNNKKNCFVKKLIHHHDSPSERLEETSEMAKLPVTAKPAKPVRLNGVHKSVEERVKVQQTNRHVARQDKVRSVAVAASNGDTKTRTSRPVSATVQMNGKAKLNAAKDTKAKRKRRRVNKTGFDKPRKRNKTLASTKREKLTLLPPTTNTTVTLKRKTPPKPNGLNANSSQSKVDVDKKIKRKAAATAVASSDASSSTEIDDEPIVPNSINKKSNKARRSSIAKVANRSQKRPGKSVSNSDSSDSDRQLAMLMSASSCAFSSSEEESDGKNIPLSVDDYPVYMVTKPSNQEDKSTHLKKKVHKIQPNPFIRSVPSKKYYKVALYAKEFGKLHPSEYENLSVANLVKTTEPPTDLLNVENANLPILPLPTFFTSPDLTSTSATSSSSSQEDNECDGSSVTSKGSKRKSKRHNVRAKSSRDSKGVTQQYLQSGYGFMLSFDIWFQYKFNPLPTAMSSANYRRVRQNVFADTKPVAIDSNQTCSCNTPKGKASGCGSDCMNRLMYQECWTNNCPTGRACSNQRIQRYDWSPGLERFMTSKRGWGIRTTEPIKAGEFILEYIGEIVSDQLFKKRMTDRYGKDHHHYSMNIDAGMVIDGYRVANEGRFVNHSCEPNCEMQKWAVNGLYRMCMFALRDIEPNEELFYDYNFQNFNVDSQQTCHCGSGKCRGFIGGKKASALSTPTDSAFSIATDVIQLSDNSKDAPSSSEKYMTKLLPLLCSSDDSWLNALPKVKKHPQVEHDEENWIFVNCKTAKIKVPYSQYEKSFKAIKSSSSRTLKQPAPTGQRSVELSYDLNLLKAFAKMKPLNRKTLVALEKRQFFLLRNYRNTHRHFTYLCSAVQNLGKGGLDLNQNPYAKHKSTNYRSGSSENSSESDTSDGHASRSRSLVPSCGLNGRLRASAANMQIVQMVKQVQIFSDTCEKVAVFMKDKLTSLLSNGKDGELTKSINGNDGIFNGGMKRQYNQVDIDNGPRDGLFDFNSILEKIKSRQFTAVPQFIAEMKYHIHRLLKTGLESECVHSKKAKFSPGKVNGSTTLVEKKLLTNHSPEDDSFSLDSLLSREQIKLLQESTCAFLDNIIAEKKWTNDEVFPLIRCNGGDLPSNGLNTSALVSYNDQMASNILHLDEINRRKLALFTKKLPETKLSEVFQQNNSNSPFNLIADIEREVITADPMNLPKDAEVSPPLSAVKLKHKEELIRCICGILREEGKMIQCDRCEIWQHFECVEQFCNIDKLENSDYLCETCASRTVPLDIPLHADKYPCFDINKHYSIKYYLSLESPIKKGVQIKVGDCVYMHRQPSSTESRKNVPSGKKKTAAVGGSENSAAETNKNFLDTLKEDAITAIKRQNEPFERRECIIVRVQYLAIIEATNQRVLYGHHYLWPSETYHEPTRKFYTNEVLKSPNCEWAALEEIRSTCVVLDPATYVKGRPKGFQPNDIFICELRVDRFAKSFSRLTKSGHGVHVSTKSYAFEMFDSKLAIKRTYSPHNVPQDYAVKKQKNNKKGKKGDARTTLQIENVKTEDDAAETETMLKPTISKAKLEKLGNIINQLNEGAYFWYLLLEQEQSKLKKRLV